MKVKSTSLNLVQRYWRRFPSDMFAEIGAKKRGIYTLFKRIGSGKKARFKVVYVGMSSRSIRGRLRSHRKNFKNKWDFFSAFELKDFRKSKIKELEGMFLEIYGKNPDPHHLNRQNRFRKFKSITEKPEKYLSKEEFKKRNF